MKIALNTKADKQISIKAKTRRKVKVKQHGAADLEINPGKSKKARPKKKTRG